MEYEDRLRKVGLTTLETRRVRGDLIEVFKILNKLENVDEREFFERCRGVDVFTGTSKTRGNDFKLNKQRVRLDVAKYGFGNRIVDDWNRLPNSVVKEGSLNTFKGKVDKFLRHNRGLI